MGDIKLKKSKFLPAGIVLLILGLFLPMPITNMAQSMNVGTLRSLLFISTDLFRLCVFVGLIFLVIGLLRNRETKKQLAMQEKVTDGNQEHK